jgi:ornithine decarboxylase
MTKATILQFARSTARGRTAPHGYADAAEFAHVEAPEAPVFCFSSRVIEEQATAFLRGFPGEVAFAVKSSPSEHVIAGLHRAGIRVWDVASVQEMELVSGTAGSPVFHYHNPVKSVAEIRAAYTRFECRRFAVDCVEELEKIHGVVRGAADVEIAVRFVLPRQSESSAHDFSSKFGASMAEAPELLRRAVQMGYRPVLTFHPGSQCKDPQAYVRHIRSAADIASAAGTVLYALNVGGGFPAQYVRCNGHVLDSYFDAIKETVHRAFSAEQMPKLECEPGRGLAAACMSLLTKVKLVRHAKDEIFLNDGVYGALMEVWQVPDLQPPHRVIRDGVEVTDKSRLVTVFGPTCDPLDKLPMRLSVPADIQEGDYIEFGSLGAYGAATMTRFNGYGGHDTISVKDVLKL